jgi:hypothetical protein
LSVSGIIFIQEVLPKGKTVHIEVEGRPLYVLPIEQERMLMVDGPQGKTIIEIKNQKLRVKDSPCPKKQCVKHGWIERGVIACLPNKIVIAISNDSEEDNTVVDAITR